MLEKAYQQFKKSSYQWRAKYFQPILKLLTKMKITPNQITLGRTVFFIPIIYCFFLENLTGVLIFYLLFWFFDLLDGSLARYQNVSHDKGRFLDSVVDNFAYGLIIVGFIYLEAAIVWLLAYNILIELTVQVLGTIRQKANWQSNWLINVQPDLPWFKSISHLVLFLFYIGLDVLNPTYFILNILMTCLALYLLFKINKD